MSRLLTCVLFVLALATVASAQTSTGGKLLITVMDQSGGIIPNATVTISGTETATKAAMVTPLKTSDKGIVTFESLNLGHYAVAAEFPGFETNGLRDITIRNGDNKHVIVLALKRMQDSVTVTQDRQVAGSDRGVLFGSALTREQIDALSDDPAEMQRQLQELGGPDAVIRVDSFEGQDLPTKAQIKSIHITRDQFAAESHTAGGTFVDIITQPGVGPLRTNAGANFHNSAMEARNPLAPQKGPSQDVGYSGGIGGTLLKDRSTFNLNASQSNSYSTPNLYAATPAGTQAQNLNLRAPATFTFVSGLLDYALTKDQTLRTGYNLNRFTNGNLGVGNFDMIERAYSSDSTSYGVRMVEAGPLGRRFFTNTRFSLNASNSTSHSVTEAIAVNVLDAFNAGGAQQKGGTHSKNFTIGSDLDYVRGKNSWRAGIQLDGARYHADRISNYLGTYTFENLAAFQANTPRSFTQRIGDPTIEYWNLNAGLYLQDDIRLRKNLSLSPGVRVEAQTHLKDYSNIGPRFGATWSPFKSGKTSLRGSWGIFYDWLPTNTYVRTVQDDGFHLLNVNISNPTFPAAPTFAPGSTTPVDRYQFGGDLRMIRNTRYSASINQTISRRVSLSATASDLQGRNLLVGTNLNAPVGGVRPNPGFVNIYETNADGRVSTKAVSSNISLSLARLAKPGGPPIPSSGASAKRFDWRRSLSLRTSYTLQKSENNTDGAFAVPASGNLDAEWGPSSGDVRHRVSGGISSSALKNLSASLNFNWSSAPPLTIRTGTDDNGDLIFNDRPAGVGRNSARTVSNWGSSLFLSYSLGFGKSAPASLVAGQSIMVMNGVVMMAAPVMATSAPAAPRYRLGISVSIQNLTNHATYSGFSGNQTSPFFLRPTTAFGQRSISVSTFLSF